MAVLMPESHSRVNNMFYFQGKSKERVKRAATARPERIWDYAVIPYEIDSNFRYRVK